MSLPSELFRQLDMMVEERGLPSRSQLIAELIRHALAAHEATTRPDEMLAGTLTIVYRGDRGRVRHQLAQTQAEYLKHGRSVRVRGAGGLRFVEIGNLEDGAMACAMLDGKPVALTRLSGDEIRPVRVLNL